MDNLREMAEILEMFTLLKLNYEEITKSQHTEDCQGNGRFLITDLISLLVVGMFRFFIYDAVLIGYTSRYLSISSQLSIFWAYNYS